MKPSATFWAVRSMATIGCTMFGSIVAITVGCGGPTDNASRPPAANVVMEANDVEATVHSGIPQPLDWETHAKVRRDNEGHITSLDFRGGSFEASLASPLSRLPKLTVLRFGKDSGEPVDDSLFDSFAGGLDAVKVLAIDFQPISGTAIRSMPEAAPLVELYAAATNLDDSVDWLEGRSGLKKLRISQTNVGVKVCRQLAMLPSLETLDASGCSNVDDAAVAELAPISTLSDLNIYDTPITDAAAAAIAKMTQLKRLNLDKTAIGDQGVAELRTLQDLEFLHLGSTRITDASADSLAEMKGLKTLIVTRTEMTEAAVAKIAESLPECEIQLQYQP